MKVVSTEALTKLIQLVKSAFISVDDTVETSEVTLATVATTGDYDDLINKPTIPTVNNPTITITQGGITKGTFTTNQGSNATIALDAGGGGGAVDSVNGKTGVVVLTATDVGALPDNTVIPTVNNPTITITQGGVTKGSFTLNQASGDTIALDAGGGGGAVDFVVDFQAPTAANNYTWYRKYASGWVEQGGLDGGNTYKDTQQRTVNLPIEMADNHYIITHAKYVLDGDGVSAQFGTKATTYFTWSVTYKSSLNRNISWMVCGMAAN